MLWILILAVLDLMQCTYKVTKLNSYYFIHINHKLVLNGEHKQIKIDWELQQEKSRVSVTGAGSHNT